MRIIQSGNSAANESQSQSFVQKTIDLICEKTKLENESTDPDEFSAAVMERVAIGLVKSILLTEREKKNWQLFAELSFLLQSLLLQRGQHQVFNKLVDRMLSVAVSLPSNKTLVELINLLWGYKCLNKASSLIEMKKNATATQEANQAVKVLRNGMVAREHIPGLLV